MRNVHLPHFSGVPRQRGRGLGALAGTIARTAFPILSYALLYQPQKK